MPFYKGHTHSEETRKKLSEAGKGRIPWNKGKKGQVAWNKGLRGVYKTSEETRQKQSLALSDEKSSTWKGDEVSYSGIHKWINKKLGKPDTCSYCKTSGLSGHQIHWANISQEYKRDLSDWVRLCASCHSRFDNQPAKAWATRRQHA